jgi:hypothetical protein
MQPLPNQLQRLVNSLGNITTAWSRYLQQFTQAPPNIMTVEVGVSPFSYEAKEPGYVIITGGVVSAILLSRGAVDINLTGARIVPVSINDFVIITYTGLPTVQFIPIYGANASP